MAGHARIISLRIFSLVTTPCWGGNGWNFVKFWGTIIDGLVQERRNSIANALELRLSCSNPSICEAESVRFADSDFIPSNLW